MKNFIAFDVASEVCTVCVMDTQGKIKQESMVVTKARELKSFVRSIPGQKEVIFEEGTQAAWLYTLFEPLCSKVTVCDPVKNAALNKKSKSDKVDARNLAKWARAGLLSPVWHGGEKLQRLKELLRTYETFVVQSTRVKNQIRAVFRGRGLKGGAKAYLPETRAEAVSRLPLKEQRARVVALGEVLDVVQLYREITKKQLIEASSKFKMYKPLKAIDGLGPVSCAVFIGEVGDPFRFRTRKQFWSYCGLAVITRDSGEYYVDSSGLIIRKTRAARTRGLCKQYNRHLKCLFKHAALVSGRTKLKGQYQKILRGAKDQSMARLTLSRKLAAVALRIAKTGDKYNVELMFA